MRLLSVILAFLAAGALAAYVLTCSVNNTPPAPVHPIVGKWEQVTQNGRPVAPGLGMAIEYRPDGVVVFRTVDREGVWSEESGRYTVSGSSMRLSMPHRTTRIMGAPEGTVEFIMQGDDRFRVNDNDGNNNSECARVHE